MRQPFVAGNWKMHKTLDEARALISGLRPLVEKTSGVRMAVCPPATLLFPMAKALDGSRIELGAQNCYCEASGAFTGEVSPQMLLDAGCKLVIIGHSERRHVFGEDNALLQKKVRKALEAGLEVIYCVGELLSEREADQTESVVSRQLVEVLGADLDANRLTIAYEPVWAIGTGKTATLEQAQEVHRFIRSELGDLFGTAAERIIIQYGGSVKPDNAAELMVCPDVDGALVGGACLVAEHFAAIISAASGSRK